MQLKTKGLMSHLSSMVYDLPSPSSLSTFWNWGSLMGVILGVQLSTGLFLSLHYISSIEEAFLSVDLIVRESSGGWFMRMLHANGASAFFMASYLHTGRGLYYQSYRLSYTWTLGVMMLLVLMAAAFLGYVLPWGQMSFWGATVITNLISAVPVIGQEIVTWVWGGFSVSQATLTRFFSFHFLAPFILTVLVVSHLMMLHETGSSNPLGLPMNSDKVLFSPYFIWKDLVGFIVALGLLLTLVSVAPWKLGDPENFIPANPMVTPVHIQPEWYFLFAYAVLRSVPSKLGGVVLLLLSILVLLVALVVPSSNLRSSCWYPTTGLSFWSLVGVFFVLTWIGARPIEEPFYTIGQASAVGYFSLLMYVLLGPLVVDKALKQLN